MKFIQSILVPFSILTLVGLTSPLQADILIGATGSYNALSAGQEYRGPTTSLSTIDGTVTVHAGSASLFLQSIPDPILPHVYLSPYFDLSSQDIRTDEAYLQATTAEAGYGLYAATGNLYRGDVGFFLGLIAAGRVSDLEGEFNFGRSTVYETYLAFDGNSLDHIDVLNYSRDQAGTLSDERKMRYLLLKSGNLSREQYIVADIGFSRKINFERLAILALLNNSDLNQVHKYYMLDQEATEKRATFYGFAPVIELGYMGDNFLIKYKGSLPMRFNSSNGNMSIETHSLTLGVFFRI